MDLGAAFLSPIAEQNRVDISQHQDTRAQELQPATLAHQIALGRESTARADQMETQVVGEKKAAELIAQALADPKNASSGALPASAVLTQQAHIFAQAGLPNKSLDAMKAATIALGHEQVARAADVRAKLGQLQQTTKMTELAGRLLGNVTDAESWNAANDAFKEATGQDSPLAGLPYDPKLVEILKGAGTTAKQKADLAMKAEDLKSRIAARASANNHRTTLEDLARQRLDDQRAKASRDGKVGGKDVGAPAAGEVAAAKNLIKSDVGLAPGDDLNQAAYDVAAQARALRKQNPGISADEAMRQTIMTKKGQGDFVAAEENRKLLGIDTGFGGKPAAYAPAQTLPAGGKASDLKVGQRYRDGSGRVMEWTGKGWKAPAARSGAAGSSEESNRAGQF